MIPFNDQPDIKPYPVLLLQDKQRINYLIKAVHAKLCGVQPDLWPEYASREQTRWEHLTELYRYLELSPFSR
ncbi:DUF4158 domain-containing protein, partial [Escherichia coli]